MPSHFQLTLLVISSLVTLGYVVYNCQRLKKTTASRVLKNYSTSTIENRDEKKLKTYKEVYHKLQNLENQPEVVPIARELLFNWLSAALSIERSYLPQRSILNIEEYEKNALDSFVKAENDAVLEEWSDYVQRRDSGQSPELFSTRDEATEWLCKHAPVKYVDGAWLGHIHKITTPFILRDITKDAWQVLSEELGDGDLAKNHVFLYRALLRSVGIELPDANSEDFIRPQLGMDDEKVWKGAVAQLLISLFPHEFLPEVLGFNLHYEMLTMETLKASKELPEFGISGYYFALHVSIDNADSGHTAMAQATVMKLMDLVKNAKYAYLDFGTDVHSVWKRVQAGYLLSKSLSAESSPRAHSSASVQAGSVVLNRQQSQKIIELLRRKANVSEKIHCTSRVKFGQKTLHEWLSIPEESVWRSENYQIKFLADLANASPWVCPGDSDKSLLIRQMMWKGKMFGAFTNSEVEQIRAWIDSLTKVSDLNMETTYWREVGRHGVVDQHNTPSSATNWAVAGSHFTGATLPLNPLLDPGCQIPEKLVFAGKQPLSSEIQAIHASVLLPLWFAHPCLLESVVSTPYRTLAPINSLIVRILRAESGFLSEGSGISGMDEQLFNSVSSTQHPSLVSLGLEIAKRQKVTEITCLEDVLNLADQTVKAPVLDILALSQRPIAYRSFLLGLSRAFMDLEDWVISKGGLLEEASVEALKRLRERKVTLFEECLKELTSDQAEYYRFVQGFEAGRDLIEKALFG